MEVLVGKSSINGPCSIAMLNYQRVNMQTSSHLTVAESLRFNRTASGLRSMTLALHISFVTLEGSKLSQVNHGKSMWIICRKNESCSGIFSIGFSMALILEASLKNPFVAGPRSRVWHLFTIHFKVTRGDASEGDRWEFHSHQGWKSMSWPSKVAGTLMWNLPVSHSWKSFSRCVVSGFLRNLQVAWEWTNWQEWNTLEHWPVDLPKAKHDKAWFRVSSMAYWAIASQLMFF